MAPKSRHFTDVCMAGSTNLPPNIQRSVNFRNFAKLYRKIPKISPGRVGSGGREQGVHTPPPPEMTCGFLIQLVLCKKKNYVVYWC